MKITRIVLFCSVFVAGFVPVLSQDEPRAAWQVTRFDISADTTGNDRNLVVHSTLTIKNVGAGAGSIVGTGRGWNRSPGTKRPGSAAAATRADIAKPRTAR